MVDLGQRLAAAPADGASVDWLEREFIATGLTTLPRDNFTTDRWLAQDVALDILNGSSAGPVKVATYFPRSQETPPGGVTGPLVYGGTAPAPSLSFTGPADLQASLARYPSELASWASGLSGLPGGEQGSILLVDLPAPVPMTGGELVPGSPFPDWPGHQVPGWAAAEVQAPGAGPGPGSGHAPCP